MKTDIVLIIGSVVMALILGGVLGHCIGRDSVYDEATKNGAGYWTPVGAYSNEFHWYPVEV